MTTNFVCPSPLFSFVFQIDTKNLSSNSKIRRMGTIHAYSLPTLNVYLMVD